MHASHSPAPGRERQISWLAGIEPFRANCIEVIGIKPVILKYLGRTICVTLYGYNFWCTVCILRRQSTNPQHLLFMVIYSRLAKNQRNIVRVVKWEALFIIASTSDGRMTISRWHRYLRTTSLWRRLSLSGINSMNFLWLLTLRITIAILQQCGMMLGAFDKN